MITVKSIQRSNGFNYISTKSTVRNLGCCFFFNLKIKMIKRVQYILKCGYHQLRQLSVIRKCLTSKPTSMLVVSTIYRNLIIVIHYSLIFRTLVPISCNSYRVHVFAFCLKERKFDHISDVLKDFHWLPVRAQIHYKILMWVYKCLKGLAPEYLSSLI